MRKRNLWKKVGVFMLAATMVIGELGFSNVMAEEGRAGGTESPGNGAESPGDGVQSPENGDKEETPASSVVLRDSEFTGDLWNDGIWTIDPSTWENASFEKFTYAEDKWLTIGENQGTTCLKFWMKDEGYFTVTQKVDIPAGTYKVSADFMGEKADVQLMIGEQVQDVHSLSGYNIWMDAADVFTIEEDLTDVEIGFKVTVAAGGYGYLDSIAIERKKTVTLQDSEFTGNLWNDGIWTIDPSTWENTSFEKFTYADDKWLTTGENQGATCLKFWMKNEGYFTVTQKVDIPAGTYTVSADFMGEKADVQLMIGKQVQEAHSLSGYNNWIDAADVFTIEEDLTNVEIGFKVTVAADGYGYLDSIAITEGNAVPGEDEDDDSIPVEGDLNVEKIRNLSEDFIMGMDISSVMSEFASGVTYEDYDGNTIDNITDFCKFLASNGITHIRVRVWNDPYDENGNGYGGGNNDVATAAEIAKGCRAAGLKMLIDFHCSDFWADPGKQQVPKAWTGYTLEQKTTALKDFIGNALKQIDPNYETVAMVQVGNETTGGFVGETSVSNMCTLFSAGAEAVRAYNSEVKVVIHVTNPEKGNVTRWAKNLDDNQVDYDIIATSYYPYWHGTLANLKSQFQSVKETYGKDVMVAETSYAYTLKDSDGHDNTVRVGNNDSGDNTTEPFTVQGQATALRNLMETVNEAGGLGVFYWESAWITVGDTTGLTGDALDAQIAANKEKWEEFGSGWAASYAGEYDAKDAGKWYGGSAVDNEAMFYPDGTPTAGLHVWEYVKTGAVSKYISVESIADQSGSVYANSKFTLPETVAVTYNSGIVDEKVTWNAEDIAAVDIAKTGTYNIRGTVAFSKKINQGEYAGKTEAEVVFELTVKAVNLITDADDAGFEKGANFTIGGTGISGIPSTNDPYEGKGSMHWYNAKAATGTVTYNKVIALEAGKYCFTAVTQGFAGDKVTLLILDKSGEILFQGEPAVLEGWINWKTPFVTFSLEEKTEVKLQILVEMQDGGWGTADCLYLYEVEEEPENPGEPTEPTEPENPGEPTEPTEPENPGESTTPTTPETPAESETPTVTETPATPEKQVTEEVVKQDGKDIRKLQSTKHPGLTVSGGSAVLPEGADLTIEPMRHGNAGYQKAADAVAAYASGVETFVVYDISIMDSENVAIHQLGDYVSVTLPIPDGLTVGEGKQIVVYRLEDNGTLTRCQTTVTNGMITFETDHFSTYIFAVETADTAGTKTATPNTSDSALVWIWFAVLLLMAGSVVLRAGFRRKHA